MPHRGVILLPLTHHLMRSTEGVVGDMYMCAKPTAKRGISSIRLAAAAAAPLFIAPVAQAAPFFMGSDISLETFMQQQGVAFKDNGVAAPADQILYNNGDNLFRLRLFVNPNTSYSATEGAIQTTAYDISLAQQIKADDPSAKIELDLHYSDTWADPGHQSIPAAWSGDTLSQLQTSVYNYTLNTLNSFKSAGVLPDIVQIGNETNNGMLWGTDGQPGGALSFSGSTASQQATWAAFGSLVNSGISAVHAAQGAGPKILVSLVIGNGNSSGEPAYFYGNLTNSSWGNVPASSFDIMGVDYYPSTNDMSTLSSNLTTLANNFGTKKIMVMETDAPWETDNGLAHDTAYAETQAGQASYFSALATTVQNLPNGDGMGLLYWYPEAVQVPGYAVYNGGATALFNGSGNVLQTIIGTAGAGASGNGDFSITQHQWNTSASGSFNTSANWTNSTPDGSDVRSRFPRPNLRQPNRFQLRVHHPRHHPLPERQHLHPLRRRFPHSSVHRRLGLCRCPAGRPANQSPHDLRQRHHLQRRRRLLAHSRLSRHRQ